MPAVTATILPTEQDACQAREFSALLAPLALQEGGAQIHFHGSNAQSAQLTLPAPLVRLLLNVLAEIGKGNGVTITPVQKEFTTQQAEEAEIAQREAVMRELMADTERLGLYK